MCLWIASGELSKSKERLKESRSHSFGACFGINTLKCVANLLYSRCFVWPQTMSIFEQNVLIQSADMSIVSKYNNFELKQIQSIFDMTALPKSILLFRTKNSKNSLLFLLLQMRCKCEMATKNKSKCKIHTKVYCTALVVVDDDDEISFAHFIIIFVASWAI